MYWRIILDSIYGTKYFLTMLAVILLAFSFAIYILDQNQQQMFRDGISPVFQDELFDQEYGELTQNKLQNEILDSIFTQYLLMLGEFEILGDENLETYPRVSVVLLYSYFLMATFFTQVVFFNVLVAVISEAYAESWEKKELFAV